MPLKKGKSNETREKNIAMEIAEGKSPKQAVAIGYNVQRESGGSPQPPSNAVKVDRPHGTPSGRVGSAGYVNRDSYEGSPVEKTETNVNSRKQTGSHPTHSGGDF